MKRIVLKLGLVGLLGLLGFVAFLWMTLPNHCIDRTSFDKIAKGMSAQEVEAILRCPPGKYCSAGAQVEVPRADGSLSGMAVDEICNFEIRRDGLREAIWVSDNGVILILFDAENKVAETEFGKMYSEGFLTRARRWLASIL